MLSAMSGLLAGTSTRESGPVFSTFQSWASSEPLFSPASTVVPLARRAMFVNGLMMRHDPESSLRVQHDPSPGCPAEGVTVILPSAPRVTAFDPEVGVIS